VNIAQVSNNSGQRDERCRITRLGSDKYLGALLARDLPAYAT
jgi:hypothetical protein